MNRTVWLFTLSGWVVAALVTGVAVAQAHHRPQQVSAVLLDTTRLQLDVCMIDMKAWEEVSRDLWTNWRDRCRPGWDGEE